MGTSYILSLNFLYCRVVGKARQRKWYVIIHCLILMTCRMLKSPTSVVKMTMCLFICMSITVNTLIAPQFDLQTQN